MNINLFRRKFRKQIDLIKPSINLLKKIIKPSMNEKKVHLGERNPDKIIYIIRNSNPKAGLFSLLNTIVEKTMYAIDRNYYPVVDMMNYQNSYLEEKLLGKENAWDYFFKPLTGYNSISLADAYKSKNVILSSLYPTIENYYFDAFLSTDHTKKQFKEIKKIFKKYFLIKDELINKYEKIANDLIGEKNVLGVLCRGTDYAKQKPYAHPIQPTTEMVFKKIDEFIFNYKCTYIYLCTEDKTIVNQFKKRYGNQLLIYPREYVELKNIEYITDLVNKNISPKKAGIDYLGQVYVLSKCNYGILSLTSATPFVCFMSNYEDFFIWNLGRYGFDD